MYVYFIGSFGVQELERIKIGMSDDPMDRMRRLQTGSPVKLKMLGMVRCRDREHAKSVERLAHNIFHKQRRRGEWFHLRRSQKAQILSLIEKASERQTVAEMPPCVDCGRNYSDPPSKLCPGCEAYQEHQR